MNLKREYCSKIYTKTWKRVKYAKYGKKILFLYHLSMFWMIFEKHANFYKPLALTISNYNIVTKKIM